MLSLHLQLNVDAYRHDNDRKLPRTTKEIYELNRAVARKMELVFSSKGIPVIPSIGTSVGIELSGGIRTQPFCSFFALIEWCRQQRCMA